MTTTTSRLVGLQKTSMIDYPGKLAAVLFFPGCNLKCPYCHNAPLAAGSTENMVTLQEAKDYLRDKEGELDALVLTGGEPLLQGDGIFNLIAWAQLKGYKVKLDTNGTVKWFWKPLFNQGEGPAAISPDYVAIDLKMLPDEIRKVESEPFCYQDNLMKLSVINKKSDWPEIGHPVHGEIRTTVHKAVTPDLHLLKEAWGPYIDGLPWYLQQYRKCEGFDPALQYKSTYSDEELAQLAISFGAHIRGVSLDLIEYVDSKLEENKNVST